MTIAAVVLTVALAQQAAPSAAQPEPQPFPAPDCKQLLASNPPPPVVQLCQADATLQHAGTLAPDSPELVPQLRAAGELYSRAAHLLQDPAHRVYAYDMIARLYDPAYLNEPSAAENALRQIATLIVDSPAPLLRLARFQEAHVGVEAAENTLLGARQQHPMAADVPGELAGFYGRRASAVAPKPQNPDAPPAAAGGPRGPGAPLSTYKPNCQQYSFGTAGSGLAELCTAESELRKANASKNVVERAQLFRAAADLYERAASSLRTTDERVFAYEAAAGIYGPQHLNSHADLEQALRQIIALVPGNIAPVLRLVSAQEQQQLVDAAESTLLTARQQFPGDVELYKALSAFYARLAKPPDIK